MHLNPSVGSSSKRGSRSLFREFYVQNGPSLLRNNIRSQSVGTFLLLMKGCYLFSLILTDTYLSFDASGNLFISISLHRISDAAQEAAICAFTAFNILIFSTIISLYCLFCLKRFEERTLPFLSLSIMNYNYLILLPSLFLSSKQISNLSSYIEISPTLTPTTDPFTYIAIINLILTIIIGMISSLHSGRFYSYIHVDSLAKKGSTWDFLKPLAIAIPIIIIEFYEADQFYKALVGGIAAINVIDLLRRNSYYTRRTSEIFTSINMNLILISLINLIQSISMQGNSEIIDDDSSEASESTIKTQTSATSITGIVLLLSGFALTHKLSEIIIDRYTDYIIDKVDAYVNSSSSSSNTKNSNNKNNNYVSVKLSRAITIDELVYIVDFFTRYLFGKTTFTQKKQKLHASLFSEMTRFPSDEHSSRPSSEVHFNQNPSFAQQKKQSRNPEQHFNHLGALIEEEESFAIQSMKEQVKMVYDFFYNSRYSKSINRNSNNTNHNSINFQDSSTDRPQMEQLYYLLEITENYTKLAVKLQEFMRYRGNSNNRTTYAQSPSLLDEALIRHLEREMNRRESAQRQSSPPTTQNIFSTDPSPNQTNQNNQNANANSNKQHSNNGIIDLALAFTFQEELTSASMKVISALKQKIHLINEISQDLIDLSRLQVLGEDLVNSFSDIAIDILHLRARSLNCGELTYLSRIFVESLWIDPWDSNLKLLWILTQPSQNSKSKRSTQNIEKIHAITQMNKFYKQKQQASQYYQQSSNNNNNFFARIDFKAINHRECTIMASLSQQRLGRILKVSDSCTSITGFTPNELVNQNVTIIQPSAIASMHNALIRKGIEIGMYNYYDTNTTPLIMKRKDGFGLRVKLEFQTHTMGGVRHASEIALIGKLTVQERFHENYVLLDVSNSRNLLGNPSNSPSTTTEQASSTPSFGSARIEIFSRFFFQEAAQAIQFTLSQKNQQHQNLQINSLQANYMNSPSDLYNIDFTQILPAISFMKYLRPYVDSGAAFHNNDTSFYSTAFIGQNAFGSSNGNYGTTTFESIAFIPIRPPNKRRLLDSAQTFQDSLKKRHFNVSTNAIFHVLFRVTHYQHNDGYYNLALVEFNEFKHITDYAEITDLITHLFVPQLLAANLINASVIDEIHKYILTPVSSLVGDKQTYATSDEHSITQLQSQQYQQMLQQQQQQQQFQAINIQNSTKHAQLINSQLLTKKKSQSSSKMLSTDDIIANSNNALQNQSTASINNHYESQSIIQLNPVMNTNQNQEESFRDVKRIPSTTTPKNANHNNHLYPQQVQFNTFASPRVLTTQMELTQTHETLEGLHLTVNTHNHLNHQSLTSLSPQKIPSKQNANKQSQQKKHISLLDELDTTSLNNRTIANQNLNQSRNLKQKLNESHSNSVSLLQITSSAEHHLLQLNNSQQQQHYLQLDSKHNIMSHLSNNLIPSSPLNMTGSQHRLFASENRIPYSERESEANMMVYHHQTRRQSESHKQQQLSSGDPNTYNTHNNYNYDPEYCDDDGNNNNEDDIYNGDNNNNNNNEQGNNNNNMVSNRKKPNSLENDLLDQQRNSISSHLSSQSNSLRNAFYRSIFRTSNSTGLQQVLLVYISFSFLVILLIVSVTYFSVKSQITKQQLSFTYSWWQDQISNYILSILRFTKAYELLVLNGYQIPPDMILLRDSISTRISSAFELGMNRFKSLGDYSFDELYLSQIMHETINVDYIELITPLTNRTRTISFYDVFVYAFFVSYQIGKSKWSQEKLLQELELITNLGSFQEKINQITDLQTTSQQDLVNEINLSVLISLIVILCISNAIAVVFLPFFYKFQTKKEFILRLFASIEPASLREMYDIASDGLHRLHRRFNPQSSSSSAAIVNSAKALHHSQSQSQISPTNKNRKSKIHRKSALGGSGATATAATGIAIPQTTTTRALDFSIPLVPKKRKNGLTLPFEKISLRLIVQILVIILTICIQPFVNVFLISDEISESKTELGIVKGLYKIQSSLMQCQYFMYAHSGKLADPTQSYIPINLFGLSFAASLTALNTDMNTLVQTYQSLSSNSRYQDTAMGDFLENIFTKDLCYELNNASASYFVNNNADSFNYDECIAAYNGVLKHGLLQAVNKFTMMFEQFGEIVAKPAASELEKFMDYMAFYTENSMTGQESLFNMIKIASYAVITCISEEKETYHSKINLTQILLFLFEIIFVICIFPIAVYPFFEEIKQSMAAVIQMLSVLQLQYIRENSYISNFIQQFAH